MNLKPPPETEDIGELKGWCDELYEFLKHPVFQVAEFGNTSVGNYMTISNTGDTVFVGGSGLSFGSCYGNHIAWTQANAVHNTWYNISDSDMADGILNNVAHDGSGKLTVTYAGMYLISYTICYSNDTANDHVEAGIEVSGSGSANAAGQSHSENKFANEEEHLSGMAILDLAASATIEIAIRTTDEVTPDFMIGGLNISVLQVGGT